MRFALVRIGDGSVTNVILANSQEDADLVSGEGCTAVLLGEEDIVGPGWRRQSGQWINPDPEAPPPSSPEQQINQLKEGLKARDAVIDGLFMAVMDLQMAQMGGGA